MGRVIIGMDPHKRSATVEIINGREKVLAQGRFGTDRDGYQAMLQLGRRHKDRIWAGRRSAPPDLVGSSPTYVPRLDSHGYRLGPPLAPGKVADFERRHGVSLTAGYRTFVTRMGNGGAGTAMAVPAPPTACCRWSIALRAFVSDGPYGDVLTAPFPVEPDRRYGADWLAAVGLDEHREWYPGTIALSVAGCGMYCVLVVTGSARGRIACTSDHFTNPPRFRLEPDFLSWYETWPWSVPTPGGG